MMGKASTQDATYKELILVELKQRQGQHVTTKEVAEWTKLTREQVTSALHQMRKSMKPYVRRVGDAVWVYDPTRVAGTEDEGGRTFEAVGNVDGIEIVRGPDGRLYEVNDLELMRDD